MPNDEPLTGGSFGERALRERWVEVVGVGRRYAGPPERRQDGDGNGKCDAFQFSSSRQDFARAPLPPLVGESMV